MRKKAEKHGVERDGEPGRRDAKVDGVGEIYYPMKKVSFKNNTHEESHKSATVFLYRRAVMLLLFIKTVLYGSSAFGGIWPRKEWEKCMPPVVSKTQKPEREN